MKVICDRSALLDAINLVSGAVASRTPRPQLQCVKMTATKDDGAGELALVATDGEISLSLKLGRVDVERPGEALIPADKLRQIVSAEDDEPTLTLEVEDEAVHIRGKDAHFKVFGYPPSDFPAIPSFEDVANGAGGAEKAKAVFTHSAGALETLISRTAFATAKETSRYAINGVLFKRDGKRLELVATDGRRLALCRSVLPASDKETRAISCIVPTKALTMLQKLFADPEEPVRIAITDGQIYCSVGGGEGKKAGGERAVMSSNLVEGTFPPYEDVIPKDHDKRVVFDRDVLSSAVRRAALLTNEESRGVRLSFQGKTKKLELSSRAPEMGEAQVRVDLSKYDGDDLEIGFNPTFITDALKVINDPEVILELKAGNKPGLIRSGTDFVYVVMPVNLQ
ncbi:MAG: DNA polymerase III subunit beta [Phycisphaeraceae bacterium]|nr:MAG: DNA polymerase III subunit beta [Phycisphaeraceae bacterium]